MQNNLRNRSVALASTFALALTGIVATAPAASANAGVDLAPTSGTNLGAFITDDFQMDIDVNRPNDPDTLAIKIDNPSKENLRVTLPNIISSVTVRGITATGTEITLADGRIVNESNSTTYSSTRAGALGSITQQGGTGAVASFDVDFDVSTASNDIVSLLLFDLVDTGANTLAARELTIGVQVLDTDNTPFVYGDGNQGDITVTSWVEIEADADYTTVDSATASAAATVKFYDPKGVSVIPGLKRFVDGNGNVYNNDATENAGLAGTVRFVRPDLNLAQVDLEQWLVQVMKSDGNTATTARTMASERVSLAGTRNNDDTSGAVHITVDHTTNGSSRSGNFTLANGTVYNFRVTHTSDTTRTFNSVAFNPPTGDVDRELYVTITDSDNSEQDNTAPVTGTVEGIVDTSVTLRPSVESFTYNARLYKDGGSDPDTREKEASKLIAAKVTAGTFMPTGTELTVSGTNTKLSAASQAVFVTGLSDSDGDYSVTVTSSNPVAATSYTVEFFTLDKEGLWINTLTNSESGNTTAISAVYTAASIGTSALTLDNTVLAGTSVTASGVVKDSYGVATNKNGSDDLYFSVVASDSTDLKETVAVAADGTASITFDNFVDSGESDLISVFLHEGSSWSTSTTNLDTEVISLYNPGAVAGVNVPDSVTGNITYDDFIVGTASSTNVAPNDNTMEITGTIVDANGSGVPGAVVTIDADGMQLRKKLVGQYAQDTITFAADAAGGFTVQLWSHVVSPTGVDVTISSGGQSDTTTVKTYLPENLSGGNLIFSMDVPANIDVNKTYAIQASLTDKWGNPVKTSGNAVSIQGFGSVNINSKDDGATTKDFGSDGKSTVFLRSIKDIEGPGSVTATLAADAVYSTSATATDEIDRTEVTTDVAGTVHDETSFSNEIEVNVNVGDAPASTSTDTKVNAGSFKGYVALYAKGYEGQRMSAIVAGKWLQVDSLASNFERIVRFTGAGYDINIRIYIDGKQVGEEFNILTK